MRLREAAPPAALVLLLFAGYVKGSPLLAGLPVDLTLLGVILTALFCATGFLRDRGRFPAGMAWVAVLAVAFMLPISNASSTTYGSQKVDLLAVTLVSLVGPMFIISSRERLWWLVRWLALGGIAVTLLAQYGPQADIYERLATAGGGTIGFGRATGTGLVAVAALALGGKMPRLLAGAVGLGLAYSLVGSGSRGPLVAAGLSILLMVALRRSAQHRVRDTLAAAALGAVGLWWAFGAASTFTQDRILLLFANDQGTSIDTRFRLYGIAARAAWDHPRGLGWGGLERLMYPLAYPHNIVLEVFGEGGWPAGVVLVLAVTVAFVRAYRLSVEPVAAAVMALLAFQVVNAMVSGDVNDNRAMFAMLGLALALPGVLHPGAKLAEERPTDERPGIREGRSRSIGSRPLPERSTRA